MAIIVDYDTKVGRFKITCPPWDNDSVRSLPNRKWDPKIRVWTAPAIRRNVEYIKTVLHDAEFTRLASARLMEEIKIDVECKNKIPFPREFKFKTKPLPFQIPGMDQMFALHAFGLYMDMGTCKTSLVIYVSAARHIHFGLDRILVVCPTPIKRNWEREFELHCPIGYDLHLLDTTKESRFCKWKDEPHPFKILVVGVEALSMGKAHDLAKRFLLGSAKSQVVVDESHTIKNHSAIRTKKVIGYGRMAEWRVVMSGTPIANGPLDLFAQFEFLDPEIIGIGDYYSFKSRYAVMGGYEDKQIVGYQHVNELIEVVSPFVYQVRKSEVLKEIPPKLRPEPRLLQLSEEQKRLYRQMKKERMYTHDGGSISTKTVLEKMLRLQEICGGIRAYEGEFDLNKPDRRNIIHEVIPGRNAKVEEILEIAEETDAQAIIWCQYTMEIDLVVAALTNKYGADQVLRLDGSVDQKTRDHYVHDLFLQKKARWIVGNPTVGGQGLPMYTATVVIYYSNSFKFVDREQSEDRAHRKGQLNSVTYIDLAYEGTVDEVVIDALREKKNVSEFVRTEIASRHDSIYGEI